jgi:exoribonuclease R
MHFGVLKLNKTYGSHPKQSNKHYYKFISSSFDINLQCLVPYEIKHIGFSKIIDDLYVCVELTNNLQNNIPIANIIETFGKVTDIESYAKYRIASKQIVHTPNKQLHQTITHFIKSSITTVDNLILFNDSLIDRTHECVISIDNVGTKAIDDAFSFTQIDEQTVKLSIYITNVTEIINMFNVWDKINEIFEVTENVYMEVIKKNMLPPLLGDDICSLIKNKIKCCLVFDFIINKDTGEIMLFEIFNSKVIIANNYVYNDIDHLFNENKTMLNINSNNNSNNNKIINLYLLKTVLNNVMQKEHINIEELQNAKDIVQSMMILTNKYVGNRLKNIGKGILKRTEKIENSIERLKIKEITMLFDYCSQYVKIEADIDEKENEETIEEKENNKYKHEIMNVLEYGQITSPIRRIVDLVNQTTINMFGLDGGAFDSNFPKFRDNYAKIITFIDKWLNLTEHINKNSKNIKKIQNDCKLISMFYQNPQIQNHTFMAINLGKSLSNHNIFQYSLANKFNIYIPDLKFYGSITLSNEDNASALFSIFHVQIFLANTENNLKKKLKIKKILH